MHLTKSHPESKSWWSVWCQRRKTPPAKPSGKPHPRKQRWFECALHRLVRSDISCKLLPVSLQVFFPSLRHLQKAFLGNNATFLFILSCESFCCNANGLHTVQTLTLNRSFQAFQRFVVVRAKRSRWLLSSVLLYTMQPHVWL